MTKRTLIDSMSIRVAKARRKSEKSRALRLLGGRGAAALILGGVLSLGGLTESLNGAHILVQKDLDSVKVVTQKNGEENLVADLHDGFAANSVFKLSRALPDRYVTREISLFDEAWLKKPAAIVVLRRDVFHEEMARINNSIKRDFFANAMPYGDLIHEKAAKYDVDPALVAAVVEQESRFRSTARSPVGARGLMQLMPRTGRWLGAHNLYDPEQNIDAGVKYIRYLQARFDGNVKKTIAAYNAGEGNVRRYGGIPPFRETQTYVKHVMRNYAKRNAQLKQYGADRNADGEMTLR